MKKKKLKLIKVDDQDTEITTPEIQMSSEKQINSPINMQSWQSSAPSVEVKDSTKYQKPEEDNNDQSTNNNPNRNNKIK